MDARNPRGKISCIEPFRKIEILRDGNISMCCPTWLPLRCGNMLTNTVAEIMSDMARVEVQEGMRQGDFRHCTKHCPYLSTYTKTDAPIESLWPLVPIERLQDVLSRESYCIFMSYDESCNLQCPSCRTELIWHGQEYVGSGKIAAIHRRTKELVSTLLSAGHGVQIHLTGSGDPFASRLYWGYLRELASSDIDPNLSISLSTNGVMMTRGNLEMIRPLWPSIRNLSISVDAATEDTYRVVRRGGNFQKLRDNLAAFDCMVTDGMLPNLEYWQTNFIVQRDNFREMKPFVEWQLGYNTLSNVWFNRIAQWCHLDDESYSGMAVWQDGHGDRGELMAILADPIFDDPRVYLGNLRQVIGDER